MKAFLDNFYNMGKLGGTMVSDQAYQASWNLAVSASATAAVACIPTWETDLTSDHVAHGDGGELAGAGDHHGDNQDFREETAAW